MSKLPSTTNLPEADRRNGVDRRRKEGRPPGKHERRRGIESRKPEVQELEMSSSEWAALTGDEPAAPKRSA